MAINLKPLETGLTEVATEARKTLLPMALKAWAVATGILLLVAGIETFLLVGSMKKAESYEAERVRIHEALRVAEAKAASNKTLVVYRERILYSNQIVYSNLEVNLETRSSRYRFITNWWDAVRVYQDTNRATN